VEKLPRRAGRAFRPADGLAPVQGISANADGWCSPCPSHPPATQQRVRARWSWWLRWRVQQPAHGCQHRAGGTTSEPQLRRPARRWRRARGQCGHPATGAYRCAICCAAGGVVDNPARQRLRAAGYRQPRGCVGGDGRHPRQPGHARRLPGFHRLAHGHWHRFGRGDRHSLAVGTSGRLRRAASTPMAPNSRHRHGGGTVPSGRYGIRLTQRSPGSPGV